ncbi:type IV secretory system conjugative DNA transfer family protein [Ectobacillus funiculus]|uniref:Type IV secretory system conjugative DNA transfer family protein n=1 Tax=Ectobacillus funiculus TaxID=137993 RepID=A0ABV5WJ41_9BACI
MFEGTATIKGKQGYTVKVINFTNRRISNRWNPFDYIREEAEVSIVANAIVASKNNPEKKRFLVQRSIYVTSHLNSLRSS